MVPVFSARTLGKVWLMIGALVALAAIYSLFAYEFVHPASALLDDGLSLGIFLPYGILAIAVGIALIRIGRRARIAGWLLAIVTLAWTGFALLNEGITPLGPMIPLALIVFAAYSSWSLWSAQLPIGEGEGTGDPPFERERGRGSTGAVAESDPMAEKARKHPEPEIRKPSYPISPPNEISKVSITQAAKVPKVFISYRREDSPDVTGRIYDRLVSELPAEHIFRDIDSIPAGVDFRRVIDREVGACDVVLAIIGPQWLGAAADDGSRRLESETDFVRLEIEAALQRGIPLIPVLVSNARMPRSTDLSPTLRNLAFRNGRIVRPDPDFHTDMSRLIRDIRGAISVPLAGDPTSGA